jgi:hypothetical protein
LLALTSLNSPSQLMKIGKWLYITLVGSHRLCGLVVRVPGCWPRGPGFDYRRYQIFWVVVGLERGPLSPWKDK